MIEPEMIEVGTFTARWERIDRAECEVDAAIVTARQLWDDSTEHRTGVTHLGFFFDGKLVRLVNKKAELR